jgi:hypothetical protein
VVRNPTRADKRAGSFKICISGPKAGIWSDFATGAKGGDLVSLVAYLKSLSRRDAFRWLRDNIFKKNSRGASAPQAADTSLQPDATSPESASAESVPESETIKVVPPKGAEHPAQALKRMGCRLPLHKITANTDALMSFARAKRPPMPRASSMRTRTREASWRRLPLAALQLLKKRTGAP